jgi:aminoglycoside phosphotransferase (APT) family kinase protein
MHSDEVRVSLDTVRRLVADQFPAWNHQPVEPVTSDGTVNAIFRIGPELSARFPLRDVGSATAEAELLREVAAMEEFALVATSPTPNHVAIGRPGHGYPLPWSVQSWLPGDVARPRGSTEHSETLALDVVQLVTALRAAPTRGRVFSGSGRGGDLTASDRGMEAYFAESEGLVDVPRLRAWWARLRTLPRTQPDGMTHGDLTPPNLLVRGDRLIGVLDCGGFGPADPALDLIVVWHLFEADARAVVRSGINADENEWRRGAAWAFEQAMGLVGYYRVTNPGMSELGRSTLERLTSDPGLSAWINGTARLA